MTSYKNIGTDLLILGYRVTFPGLKKPGSGLNRHRPIIVTSFMMTPNAVHRLTCFQAVLKMNLNKSNRATGTTATPSPSGGSSRPNKEVVINNFSNSFPGFQKKANQVNQSMLTLQSF